MYKLSAREKEKLDRKLNTGMEDLAITYLTHFYTDLNQFDSYNSLKYLF